MRFPTIHEVFQIPILPQGSKATMGDTHLCIPPYDRAQAATIFQHDIAEVLSDMWDNMIAHYDMMAFCPPSRRGHKAT